MAFVEAENTSNMTQSYIQLDMTMCSAVLQESGFTPAVTESSQGTCSPLDSDYWLSAPLPQCSSPPSSSAARSQLVLRASPGRDTNI